MAKKPIVKPVVKTAIKPKKVVDTKSTKKEREGPPGLSIKKIWKETPAYVRARAKSSVVIKKYNPDAKTKNGLPAITAIAVDLEESRTPHKCSIIGKDKSQPYIYKQKAVLVSCDCDFFKFKSEYALWYNGAALIKYSNGQPAKVTNPHNVPMVCKHLAKLILTVAEQED